MDLCKHWKRLCDGGINLILIFSANKFPLRKKKDGGECAFSYANTQAAVRSNEAPLLPVIPCTFVSGKCSAVLEWFGTNLHPRTFCRHSRKLLYLPSLRTGIVLAAGNSFMRIPLQACVVLELGDSVCNFVALRLLFVQLAPKHNNKFLNGV